MFGESTHGSQSEPQCDLRLTTYVLTRNATKALPVVGELSAVTVVCYVRCSKAIARDHPCLHLQGLTHIVAGECVIWESLSIANRDGIDGSCAYIYI